MSLTTEERAKVHRGLMRYWSRLNEPVGAISKADLLAAIGDLDDWIEDNQAAINAALPLPFRTEATAEQKTLVFCAIAAARQSIAFARQLFGEVD